jgi:hypothetical protein
MVIEMTRYERVIENAVHPTNPNKLNHRLPLAVVSLTDIVESLEKRIVGLEAKLEAKERATHTMKLKDVGGGRI